MPHIIGVGSLPDEFFTHLAAAEYTYAQHDTYSKALLGSENPPVVQVAAVNGRDVSIDSVLEILKANAVLLLFLAPVDYLIGLQNATGTALDLCKIKLEDGVPLIVYRLHALDQFHFVLPCSLVVEGDPSSAAEHEASRLLCTYSEALQYSVGLIEQCLSHSSQYLTSQSFAPRDGVTIDTLTPPTGTSFVSSVSLTVPVQGTMIVGFIPRPVPICANLELALHTYATNHPPIPNSDFSSKGGVVYTVIRYKRNLIFHQIGNSKVVRNEPGRTFYQVKDPASLLRNYLQTPKVVTRKDGNTYYYNIDLSKTLNLFKDGGATPFQYTIAYSETYSRDGVNQTAHMASNSSVQFKLTGDISGSNPIYGICMFESSVGITALVFEASAGSSHIHGSANVFLDLTFGGRGT